MRALAVILLQDGSFFYSIWKILDFRRNRSIIVVGHEGNSNVLFTGGCKMYEKVSTNLNFVEREKKTQKFWEENHIFEKSIENRKKC